MTPYAPSPNGTDAHHHDRDEAQWRAWLEWERAQHRKRMALREAGRLAALGPPRQPCVRPTDADGCSWPRYGETS
jgi:hypothetical protein